MDKTNWESSNKIQHMIDQTSKPESYGVKFKPFGIEPGLVKQVRDKFQSEIAMNELPSNLSNASKRHSATARLAYAYESYLSSEKSKIRHNTFPNRRTSSISHFGEKTAAYPAELIRPKEKQEDRLVISSGTACGTNEVSSYNRDGDNQAQTVDEIENKPSVASTRRLFENYYRPLNIGLFSSFQYQNKNNLSSYPVRQMSSSEQKLNEKFCSKPCIYPTLKPKVILPMDKTRKYPNSVNDLTSNTTYRSNTMTSTVFTSNKLLESKQVDNTENKNVEIESYQNKSSKLNGNACKPKSILKKEPSFSFLKPISPIQTVSQENCNPKSFMLKNKTNSENSFQITGEVMKKNSSSRECSQLRSSFNLQPQTFNSTSFSTNDLSEKKPLMNCIERNSGTNTKIQAKSLLFNDQSPKLTVQQINLEKNLENKGNFMGESKLSPSLYSPMASLFGSPPEIASPSFDVKRNDVVLNQPPNFLINGDITNSKSLNNHKQSEILRKSSTVSSIDVNLYENNSTDVKKDNYNSNTETENLKNFSKVSSTGSQAAKKIFCDRNSSSIDEIIDNSENSKKSDVDETKHYMKTDNKTDCSNNNSCSSINEKNLRRCQSSYINSNTRVTQPLYKRQSMSSALMNVIDEMQQLFAGEVSNTAKGLKIHDFAQQKALQCKEEEQNEFEQDIQTTDESKIINECENVSCSTSPCQSNEKESPVSNSLFVASKSNDWFPSFREAYEAVEKNLKFPFLHKTEDQKNPIKNGIKKRESSFDSSKLTEKKPIKSILRPKSVEPYSPNKHRITFAPDDRLTIKHSYIPESSSINPCSESEMSTSDEEDLIQKNHNVQNNDNHINKNINYTIFQKPNNHLSRYTSKTMIPIYPKPKFTIQNKYKFPINSNNYNNSFENLSMIGEKTIKHFPRLSPNDIH